jgi:hypothetical protein
MSIFETGDENCEPALVQSYGKTFSLPFADRAAAIGRIMQPPSCHPALADGRLTRRVGCEVIIKIVRQNT